MAWHRMIPANTGGGRTRGQLSGNMDGAGQFSITHAVADMLGNPARVIVEVEPELEQLRLTPTTPDNKGGFALSGGGNSPHRIRAKEILNKWPQMVGRYVPRKQAAAVIFIKETVDAARTG